MHQLMKTALFGNHTEFEKAFTWWSIDIRNMLKLMLQICANWCKFVWLMEICWLTISTEEIMPFFNLKKHDLELNFEPMKMPEHLFDFRSRVRQTEYCLTPIRQIK